MSEKRQRLFAVRRDKRKMRRLGLRRVDRTYSVATNDGSNIHITKTTVTSPEIAETVQAVREMASAYIGTIEFYKTEQGGSMSHAEAVEKMASTNENRREWVSTVEPQRISWGAIAAVGEVSMNDALGVWAKIRDAAAEELESGKRAAEIVGNRADPFALAQFLAIRDSFADEWQPRGGIESAMIDMMAVAFSLDMYWSSIGHQRATNRHDEQKKELDRFEGMGWKSPYQSEAEAIDQAHRLADGYNRKFLRVLRQLRDLRRYNVVIQNNGGQVNVGDQQVNVKE